MAKERVNPIINEIPLEKDHCRWGEITLLNPRAHDGLEVQVRMDSFRSEAHCKETNKPPMEKIPLTFKRFPAVIETVDEENEEGVLVEVEKVVKKSFTDFSQDLQDDIIRVIGRVYVECINNSEQFVDANDVI